MVLFVISSGLKSIMTYPAGFQPEMSAFPDFLKMIFILK
ncbi:hypothetical protein AmDm5_0419 [Acetobacter malorum]|nr:hypothetical protein AmDm5_0419 [Acetobacter malorum]